MGCVAVGHPSHYDLQRPGQGSGVRHRVAGAPGCLLQSFHILHLLHWILPATGGHMSLLPAHYSQGKRPACAGTANMSVSMKWLYFVSWPSVTLPTAGVGVIASQSLRNFQQPVPPL